MTTPRHTITGKARRACPCETPALDRDAARAGSVALALTARQVWLRDFPPPPKPPGQRREQTPVVGTPDLGKTG